MASRKYEELDQAIIDLADTKAAIAALEIRHGELAEFVVAKQDQDTHVVKDGTGRLITSTIVQGTRTTLDSDGLRKALPREQWLKITEVRRVIVKDLLDAAMKVGVIKATTVAKFTTITPNAPYPRITVKK